MDAERANQRMVDRMIAEGALWLPALIDAFRATPRHRFLDRVFIYQAKQDRWKETITRDPEPDQLNLLYSDRALVTGLSSGRDGGPIVPISSSSQPSLMAEMLADLDLERGQRVLEIGTGTGYNAALIAHVVGPDRVISIDVDRDVLSRAWDNLRAYPERAVRLEQADGRAGLPAAAPYDRIIVTAAAVDLETAWLEQLGPGGVIVAPLVFAPGLELIVRGRVLNGIFEGRLARAAYFMPLRGEGESGTNDSDAAHAVSGTTLKSEAPWTGWFERRGPRSGWLRFSQSLALLGHLLGHRIHYRSSDATFSIADEKSCCWLGRSDWHASDARGRDLAWTVWQRFLELGGPQPTDYRFSAWASEERQLPEGSETPMATNPAGVETSGGLRPPLANQVFHRSGPRCRHRWELGASRGEGGMRS